MPQVIVVPSIEQLATPLYSALNRLLEHPAFSFLRPIADSIQMHSGFNVLDPLAHQKQGLNIEGPLVMGFGPSGHLSCLSFQNASDAEDWLLSLGQKPLRIDPGAQATPVQNAFDLAPLSNEPYLQLKNAVARLDGSLLYMASDRATLDAATQNYALPDFSSCPMPPGEADFYALDPQKGCLALRLDPQSLRIEAQIPSPLSGWLTSHAEALTPVLGEASVRFELALSPEALAAASQTKNSKIDAQLLKMIQYSNGLIGFAAGPELSDWTLVLGLKPETDPRAILDPILPALKSLKVEGLKFQTAPQAIRMAIPKPKDWPKALPYVDQLELRVEKDFLIATTRRRAPAPVKARSLDQKIFQNSAVTFYTGLSGAPHNGQDFADALTPFLTALEISPQKIREWASGLAYITAWFGELALSLKEEEGRWHITFEASLL